MTLSPEEAQELFEQFVRRIADQLYAMPSNIGSDYERDRFHHQDIRGFTRQDVETELELLRIRRRLLPDPWLDEREVVLQDRLELFL